jgi:hypothetical protein
MEGATAEGMWAHQEKKRSTGTLLTGKKASNILDTVGDVVTVSVAFVAAIVSSMRPTRHRVHR